MSVYYIVTNVEKIYGPDNLMLVLDASEVVPHDPGAGTPAMLHLTVDGTKYSGTFWCAWNTGDVDGYPRTHEQCRWLDGMEYAVDMFVAEATDTMLRG